MVETDGSSDKKWWGGRVVEGGSLENCYTLTGIVSSNLTPTARNRNRILKPKLGRAEGATLMHSPRQIQNPKGFSTLRVAQKVRFDP